jgi:hypothetical protein
MSETKEKAVFVPKIKHPVILSASHVFSYSQINMFNQCPYAFYLNYFLKLGESENAYAQFGTLAHSVIEKWANKEIAAEDMVYEWVSRYPLEVTMEFPPFPKDYENKSYDAAMEYFKNFNGFGEQYDIIGVEKKYRTNIGGSAFQGVVDLVLRQKDNGKIVVVDHKSKSLSSAKRDKTAHRQLYTYAHFIKEDYGEFPERMDFNLFKEGISIGEEFDEKRYEETMAWLEQSIIAISMEYDWDAKPQNFFCSYICSSRASCGAAELLKYGK